MKILLLLPRFPYPLDKGDKLRAYHQIVELAKRHEIYLFALSHTPVPHDSCSRLLACCSAVRHLQIRWWESAWGILRALLSRRPLQLGYWSSRRARQAFAAWEQQVQPDVIYCQMVRTIPTVEGSSRRKVLDFQDALSLNTLRRMQRSHGPLRLVLNYEYRALQRVEQQALSLFDAVTVISPIDRDALAISQSRNHAITIVPNGVDTDYFNTKHFGVPSARPTTLNTRHYSIVFTGNMAYAPNVDAACWLVKEIMPLVWKQCPCGVRVLIAGADPKPAVKALAGPRVTVSGRLDDIREAYTSARIFVAPMRIGSGMQNKLLEAMAMHLPCVTTSLAASPLGATPWEHLLVGDSAAELADLIVKLGTDELHHSIADAGHRFVLDRYSWHAAVEPLEKILNS